MSAQEILQPLFIRAISDSPVYINRLQEEFALIDRNRFTPVFLQVRRILQLTADIPHIIRGSAGSSLVCYLLGITHTDPIKHGLELARFMNSRRTDMPDIDMDFPYNRRAEVFSLIQATWPKQTARVSNHIHWHWKSALRQAAREAGVSAADMHRGWNIDKVVHDPRLKADIQAKAKALCGEIRTHSLHCGGIVIFDSEVPSELILKKAQPIPQLHLNKDEIEEAGFIKIDILSNRGLAILADLSDTALSDYPSRSAAITQLFRDGNNIGIVFAESRGMRKILAQMTPSNITEVAMALALIRPAAAGNGHKQLFLESWHDGTWDSDGSQSRILFDDDAINTIRELLACPDADADAWRRVFAKGRTEKEPEFAMLMERAGYDQYVISTTLENLRQLKLYSFCRSHALSYAQLVWALAYWKITTPQEFWVAVLNHAHSEYRPWVHLREARCAGLLLSRSSRPWILGQRRGKAALISASGEKEQNILISDDSLSQISHDLKHYGTWFGEAFLPGCGIWSQKEKDRVRFRGPIASGRVIGRDFHPPRPMTMIAIGVYNNIYVDLVVEGARGDLLRNFAVEGVGTIKSNGCIQTIIVEHIRGISLKAIIRPTGILNWHLET